jgi:hypothetical protein
MAELVSAKIVNESLMPMRFNSVILSKIRF